MTNTLGEKSLPVSSYTLLPGVNTAVLYIGHCDLGSVLVDNNRSTVKVALDRNNTTLSVKTDINKELLQKINEIEICTNHTL